MELFNEDVKPIKLSAGLAVFKRNDACGLKVLLVKFPHPRWRNSIIVEFPKGLVERNETPLKAALREVYEETGLKPEDVKLLPVQPLKFSYVSAFGERKIVTIWAATCSSCKTLKRTDEAEEVVWAPVGEALGLLTKEPEVEWLCKVSRKITRQKLIKG